jgi:hypothetical protein
MGRIIASTSVAAAHLEKATESDQGSQTRVILLVWSIPSMSLPTRNADQSSEAAIRGAAESNPRLLTSAEAAEFLTLKELTLRDYSRRGIVPSVKIGRHASSKPTSSATSTDCGGPSTHAWIPGLVDESGRRGRFSALGEPLDKKKGPHLRAFLLSG